MISIKRQKGMSLFGVFIVLAIMTVLFFAVKKYLSNPEREENETRKILEEQGVNINATHLPEAVQNGQGSLDKTNK